jgi:hypothetical protein
MMGYILLTKWAGLLTQLLLEEYEIIHFKPSISFCLSPGHSYHHKAQTYLQYKLTSMNRQTLNPKELQAINKLNTI